MSLYAILAVIVPVVAIAVHFFTVKLDITDQSAYEIGGTENSCKKRGKGRVQQSAGNLWPWELRDCRSAVIAVEWDLMEARLSIRLPVEPGGHNDENVFPPEYTCCRAVTPAGGKCTACSNVSNVFETIVKA